MSYFIGSQPIAIASQGNTVSIDGFLTADCISIVAPAEATCTPSSILQPPEAYAIASSATCELDIYGYSTRECFSTVTPATAQIDLGIATSTFLTYEAQYQ